ncbi:Hsp20/alpha crystallin family protein [uncultured Oscillibacter sp.]|uniref:Hsp20/alpha crystallin family protein n=1 Tax=uncultured Oscillibacter sp. TaxID=876091 RepID=UPI0025CC9D12|nr:Hsp20/alpha crystallin family protein [uncultured Oscillibacter sp.]
MLTPYLVAKNMFDELAETAFSANTLRGMMNTDIKESDQGYELDIDLPGVHKEQLAAELKDGYLCISATVEQTSNENVQNERYLRRERFLGSCRRSFYVGERVKQEDIRARFEDGILRLFIPKATQQAQLE